MAHADLTEVTIRVSNELLRQSQDCVAKTQGILNITNLGRYYTVERQIIEGAAVRRRAYNTKNQRFYK